MSSAETVSVLDVFSILHRDVPRVQDFPNPARR
jgi:hypothetical protein